MGTFNLNWKGREYSFRNDTELIKFAENMSRVESRREAAAGYVTPEMELTQEVRDQLHWREQRLTLEQEQDRIKG